jgi:hypothetical protein
MSGTSAQVELQAAVGREIASFILGEIAAHVGVKLGVSAGILGTGAGSGWATFGVGLVAGLVVDQVVTAAYDAYADPKGELTRQVVSQLDAMERLILDGSDGAPGLKSRLMQFAEERSALRETAVMQLLGNGEGGDVCVPQ